MKASAAQVRAALDKPDPRVRLILLHGPDASAAVELSGRLARSMGTDAERVDLDGAGLRSDPGRLADEAAALSLFGTGRWIRVTGAGDEMFEAAELLLGAERAGNPAVMLAPSAKTSGRLVKLAIAHPAVLSLALYPATGMELERRAADMARERGLRLAPGVAERLTALSGEDAGVLARELDKLALYVDAAPDRPAELTAEAVAAVGAGHSDGEGSALVDAVLAGDPAALGAELARARAEGAQSVAWLRQLQRRLASLAAMRAEIDRGEQAGTVMKRHRVFFREEAATAALLQRWNGVRLGAALDRARAAERAVTAPANAGGVLAEAAALSLARAGR